MPAFVVDKPLGLTSHDVVARARRALGTRRVGHGGTLDPLATGVLVVLSEEATKLSAFLTGSDKGYLAWVAFGLGTPTLDAEGPVDARGDASGVTAAAVAATLPAFLEVTEQAPPAYSAVKRGGVKGYEAARRGEALDLPPRAAGYHALSLLAFGPLAELPVGWRPQGDGWVPDPERPAPLPDALEPGAPGAVVALTVRGGTYVRAFVRDLGVALGVPAHLAGLRRTRAGAAALDEAVALDALGQAPGVDPVALLGLPPVVVDDVAARRVRDGRRDPATFTGRAALVDRHGALVAVADAVDGVTVVVRAWRGAL